MKRLSMGKIARAGVKKNLRSYLSLASGIFLSIFLITVLCLLIEGVFTAESARVANRVGFQDAFYLDGELTDEALYEKGYFEKDMGHVYVTAGVTGTTVHMGYYDKTAEALLNRSLASGRMPEKAGEIAIEQSAIERMRLDLSVGDTVTLSLAPVGGIPEERTYTVTGLLNEQTAYIDVSQNIQSSARFYRWPEMLTHETDAPFDSGRIVIHRCLKLKKDSYALKTLEDSNKSLFGGGAYVVMLPDGTWTGWPDKSIFLHIDSDVQVTIMLISVFMVSALVASAVGIAGATESNLSRKISEIGMLRAVGATKRQIRRIFGRESKFIALVLSPAAILAGTAFVKLISLAAPDLVLFSFSPWILIPIFVLTFALIFVSSMLPLRRASLVMPMNVLKDAYLLKKARLFKSKTRFDAPKLISGRRFRLHPLKPVGSILLITAMTAALAIAVSMAGYNTDLSYENSADYTLYNYMQRSTRFGAIESKSALSESDLWALKSLPTVERVDIIRNSKVNLLLDRMPMYFTPRAEFIMIPGTEQFTPEGMDYENSGYIQLVKDEHIEAQQALATSSKLVPMDLIVLSISDYDQLSDEIAGKIDLERLNAGKEVLVYAPNHYFAYEDPDSNYMGGLRHTTWDNGLTDWDHVIKNDYFVPGMEIDLVQMYIYDDLDQDAFANPDYGAHEKAFVHTQIGAVLSGKSSADIGLWSPAIITTENGARALGLTATYIEKTDVFLEKSPEGEMEEYLTQSINRIAMRGNLDVSNHLEQARKDRQQRVQATIVFFSAVIVLFSVSVGMVVGSVTRIIHAEEKKIGMLRAVGADERALFRCYFGFASLSVWPGLLIGLILTALMYVKNVLPVSMLDAVFLYLIPIVQIGFVSFAYLASLFFIKMRVRELTKRSIVDNIREA